MTRTDREAQAQHNDTTQGDRVNRFQHCAINTDEKHTPMISRTEREAQAQHNDTTQETELNFLRKIFANVKNASNDSFIAQYDSIIRDLIVFNIAQ